MIQARILDSERNPLVVFCQDGEAISKGTLVMRSGGGVMFEPDLLGDGASPPVRPGGAQRGRILDSERNPVEFYVEAQGTIEKGTLVMRPGGVILFEPVRMPELDVEKSHQEDQREARRQARAEGTDPREAAPA